MNKATNKQINKIFWEHTKKYPRATATVLIAIVLAQLCELIAPWFLKRLIDTMTQLTPNDPAAWSVLKFIILGYLGVQTANFVLYRTQGFVNTKLQTNVMADLSQSAFEATIKHSHDFFANSFAGALVRKINRLSRAYEDLADQFLFAIIPIVMISIGVVVGMGLRNIWIALLIALWLSAFTLAQFWFSRWKQPFEIAKTEEDSATTGVIADAISNSGTIRYFSSYQYEYGRLRTALQRWRKANLKVWWLNEYGYAVQTGAMILIEVGTLTMAVYYWRQGRLTLGDFILLQSYLGALIKRMWDIGRVFRRIYSSYAEAAEIVEIMQRPYDIMDAKAAKPLVVERAAIRFHNVGFSYKKTRQILTHFNLAIKPGERIALVGSSGAGKTTITNLLFRLFDVDHGKITIDDQNIAEVTQGSLRANIALVPQEPILFHRTLMENIRYGRREARDEEVVMAAKLARCHDFIMELPYGYETYVGERGVKLSGGERQRVAIARAILKNAPILVLDEATSSLDSESEALIQEALHELMKDKTVIVIAHRLSTIMEMDRIVVIENGEVIDSGRHTELLTRPGTYKTLWEIQAGGFIP